MSERPAVWSLQQAKQRFIFRFNSKFRMRWDLVVCLLAIYNCISIPLAVAFAFEGEGINIWERIVDVSFALDVLINFRTTYVNSKTGFEVFSSKKIALNYIITGRFFVDIGATIPFELIL